MAATDKTAKASNAFLYAEEMAKNFSLPADPTMWPHEVTYLEAPPDKVQDIARFLKEKGVHHLMTIIGTHRGDDIELGYPFHVPQDDSKINMLYLKSRVPVSNPVIPSLVPDMSGADVYEREVHDFLGVDFPGHPNLERLLLADDHPDDIFPLRKDFDGPELKRILDEKKVGMGTTCALPEGPDFSIAIGPQHPTHKEPIRFVFNIQGETITDVRVRLGFNHRGIEKATESRTWRKNMYLIERICGICSNAHQFAYSMACEMIAGDNIQVPERADWIRVIVNELERIHSHMLWYGVLAHDAGYDTIFHLVWRDREIVMDALEKISGNRVNYAMFCIGGVRRDISDKLAKELDADMNNLRACVQEHLDVMTSEKSFLIRLEGIGILTKEDAKRFCAVGPTARASGVSSDIRKVSPYSVYEQIPFDEIVLDNGDQLDCMRVRIEEVLESIKIIKYALGAMKPGPIVDMFFEKTLPAGQAIAHVEAARGEDLHYLYSDGGDAPYRHKVRAPTLGNIRSLAYRLNGMQIADIPLIIRGIDPCIGCMERVTFINESSQKVKIMTGSELKLRANLHYSEGKEVIPGW